MEGCVDVNGGKKDLMQNPAWVHVSFVVSGAASDDHNEGSLLRACCCGRVALCLASLNFLNRCDKTNRSVGQVGGRWSSG